MSGSNSISDAELSNINVLRERFHSLEHNRFRELAHAILRPEVLADFRKSGVDEVEIVRHILALSDMTDVWKEASASEAERAKKAPRAPRFNPRGSPREELHALSESIGIGATLPPASVEVLVRIIETQREHYENEIENMRCDFKSLWDVLFDDLAASPATAYYIFFVTQGERTTKRYTEMAFFYARAFKARIYRNYHFLSVWTYAAGALKELKDLGYTTRSAERDLIKSSQIRTLILQLKGVMMTELCQDLSKYISRALAASALYGPYFDVEWDGSTVVNKGRYMEEVKVTLRTDAFKRALPGLEASLLRLCDPSNIWESPESFRIIYVYLKGGSNSKYGVTEHLSALLSECATLVNFMDQLLRPIKAPAVAAAFATMHPTPLSCPAWDPS
ncbi:hypothetical protein PILCRDRAFT_1847 [Piloderma croceum F 1598]|uniref:Uncharacterized protein n=1 Tax=Piloderma croceum (strain F 1598) TaxID=765440 RepID=A0A0C3BVL3_PILCF|nr:hypothetical protein PILCRDRAFT_1847 [Piloderma croceum F 1598]